MEAAPNNFGGHKGAAIAASRRVLTTSWLASPTLAGFWYWILPKAAFASAWMLNEMTSRGVIPLALVFNSVNPILVQGAVLAGLPMLAGFDEDITAAVSQGSEVEVNPCGRVLTVLWVNRYGSAEPAGRPVTLR